MKTIVVSKLLAETDRNEEERKGQERMEEEIKMVDWGGKGGAKERKMLREGEGRNWCDTINSCSLMELYLDIQSSCSSETLPIYTGFSVVVYMGQDAFQLGSYYINHIILILESGISP